MKKRKIKFNLILGIIVVILILIMAYCVFDIFNSMKSKEPEEVEILDKIEGYKYELNENDSEYFHTLFQKLKTTLEAEELNEEEYASLVSQLFITDFYSLDCSLNKNDIGGTQFVYTGYQNDFISKAKTTVYNYVENNIYGTREQSLPKVKEVIINSVETKPYSFGESIKDENAYVVSLAISYEVELEYPTEVTLVLIHNEGQLEVAKMN